MKKLFLLLPIIISLIAPSFSDNGEQQGAPPNLMLNIYELIRCYEDEDIKGIKKLYSTDVTIFRPDSPFRLEGISELIDDLNQYFKDNSRIKIGFRQSSVKDEGNIAIEYGYWSISSNYRNEPMVFHGRYTRAWKKYEDSKWKCFHEHLSYLP